MKISGWRQDSGLRRWLVIGFYGALLLGVAVAIVVLVLSVLSSSRPSFSDRLAEAGDWLAGGTLLLAAIAGLVALQAYGAATGLPRLELQVEFRYSSPNQPVFQADVNDKTGFIEALSAYKQLNGRILLRNGSAYSARNPAVAVRLNGIVFVPESDPPGPGWTVTDAVNTLVRTTDGLDGLDALIIAMQWDGGPNYSIHGQSIRHISFDLPKLMTPRNPSREPPPSLTFELLAEGYRRVIEMPVNFKILDELVFSGDPSYGLPEWI